jgi:hypothetical protein
MRQPLAQQAFSSFPACRSDLWGDSGYMKLSRGNHACGVASDAVYAVVDEELLQK